MSILAVPPQVLTDGSLLLHQKKSLLPLVMLLASGSIKSMSNKYLCVYKCNKSETNCDHTLYFRQSLND